MEGVGLPPLFRNYCTMVQRCSKVPHRFTMNILMFLDKRSRLGTTRKVAEEWSGARTG